MDGNMNGCCYEKNVVITAVLCIHLLLPEFLLEKIHSWPENKSSNDRTLSKCPTCFGNQDKEYGDNYKKNIDSSPKGTHRNSHSFGHELNKPFHRSSDKMCFQNKGTSECANQKCNGCNNKSKRIKA